VPEEWNSSKLVEYLTAAGARGRTKSALQKKVPKHVQSRSSSILRELKLAGMIRGPFKNRSDYYFATQFEPKREQAEALIENLLRDAGAKLTTRSSAEKRVTGFLKTFFNDALAALKAEAKIVELKGGRKTTFYVHREAVLEQLRLASAPELERLAYDSTPPSQTIVTLDQVRRIYEVVKAEQGNIAAVKIYDIINRLGAVKEEVHRILLEEAKKGRVSLHAASTVKFPSEVMAAGIRLAGHPAPLVTIVMKEGA
jgi:hypothetical protein